VGLKTDVVLFVTPANDAGDSELSQELFFTEIFNEELAVLFAEDGFAISVGEGGSVKVAQDGFFGGEHIHSTVGVLLPTGVVFLVALGTRFGADVVAGANVAVSAVAFGLLLSGCRN